MRPGIVYALCALCAVAGFALALGALPAAALAVLGILVASPPEIARRVRRANELENRLHSHRP